MALWQISVSSSLFCAASADMGECVPGQDASILNLRKELEKGNSRNKC